MIDTITNPPYNPASVRDLAQRTKTIAGTIPKTADKKILDSLEGTLDSINNEFNNYLPEIKRGIKTKAPSKVYAWIMRGAEAVGKVFTKKTGSGKNLASAVTSVVLWGNVLKELVGTALYTVQAMTNEDLPKDKRRFVGAYDLGVGVTSTLISFILGVGVQDYIKAGYKSLLKGAKGSPKYGAVLEGLSAFTSFGLQTIVGKRILAPLVGVPVATKIRKGMENRDAKKSGTFTGTTPEQPQPAPLEYPINRQGYVDMQSFVAQVKAHQASQAAQK